MIHLDQVHWEEALVPVLCKPAVEPQIVNGVTMQRFKTTTSTQEICSCTGCTAYVFKRGLCQRHAYPCNTKGCENQAQSGLEGYCVECVKEYNREASDEYRSSKSCVIDDCNTHAVVGGYCLKCAKEHDSDAHKEYLTRVNEWKRERYNNDSNFKLETNVRNGLRFKLRKSGISTNGKLDSLGCTRGI